MRFIKFVAAVLVICCLFWLGGLLADRKALEDHVTCLHIFYDSKESTDERLNTRLKNAVASCMMAEGSVAEERYDLENLSEEISATVSGVLREVKISSNAGISINEEIIEAERYDTVFLPTGKYKVIRVDVGDGKGKLYRTVINCGNAISYRGIILERHLQETICLDRNRQMRLLFLECLGRIEKIMVWCG